VSADCCRSFCLSQSRPEHGRDRFRHCGAVSVEPFRVVSEATPNSLVVAIDRQRVCQQRYVCLLDLLSTVGRMLSRCSIWELQGRNIDPNLVPRRVGRKSQFFCSRSGGRQVLDRGSVRKRVIIDVSACSSEPNTVDGQSDHSLSHAGLTVSTLFTS
jgi:hypothetical protein